MTTGLSNTLAGVLISAGLIFRLAASQHAQNVPEIITQRVQLKKGTNSATLRGTIQGYQTRDYVLVAQAGQTMSVKMNSMNRFLYFNVLKGTDQLALFAGAEEAKPHEWTGKVVNTGDYTIRVYLLLAEARRGGKADFQGTVSIKK